MENTSKAANVSPATLKWLIVGAFAAMVAACWIIPWRLGLGPHGSSYTFGYIGDEYSYAQRIQPLIPGTTSLNPINGVCDPNLISPYYFENLLRAIITLLGLDVIGVFWMWRLVFPLCLAGLLVWLAGECLPRRRSLWAGTLWFGSAVAAWALLYNLYDLAVEYPPLQGWLNRVPTNLEYLLSVLLAVAYVRFLKAPSGWRGVALALASAVTVYLRFYTAIPWALAIGFSLPYLVFKRHVPVRVALVTLVAVVMAIAPLLAIAHYNSGFETYHGMLARYFGPAPPYGPHPNWPQFSLCAALLLAGSRLVVRPWRESLTASAAALVALIFLCGLPKTLASELMSYDRFSSFYLVALLMAALLALGEISLCWRGHRGRQRANRAALAAAGIALAGAAILGARNATYDFAAYPEGPYLSVVRDLRYLPAYEWIANANNTPPDALFLVDDGVNWPAIMKDEDATRRTERRLRARTHLAYADDLFQIVARRKRAYHVRLYGNGLSDQDFGALCDLHLGTFGFETAVPWERYVRAFARFPVEYVLWRKTAPVPRAWGATLERYRTRIYQDPFCEIWKLDLPGGLPTTSGVDK